MTSFDDAIPQLLNACSSAAGFSTSVARACVVRDLRGKLRIALELTPSSSLDVAALASTLQQGLGGYFVQPILTSDGPLELRRLTRNLFGQAEPWPDTWPDSGLGAAPIDRARWFAVRRVLSKQAWLEGGANTTPPWPLIPGAASGPPVIVSFYSYKGGVGRTTLLALVARLLAKQGKRVAVVDLDLEAPGAASFLGASTTNGRGVIDFIIDHVVAGAASIDGLYGRASDLAPELESMVDVFPAGSVNTGYLEKLGRLDFASNSTRPTASPSEAALRALLKSIGSQLKPNYILLDSRAGLHDLGGLSLHALSHVDILVCRSGPQSMAGLRIAAHSLARLREPKDRRIIVVQSLVSANRALADVERKAFKQETYEIFEESIYLDREPEDVDDPTQPKTDDVDDELPSFDDDQAAHFAWPVTRYTELETATAIGQVADAVADAQEIQDIVGRVAALASAEEA